MKTHQLIPMLAIAAFIVVGCSKKEAPPAPPPPPVTVAKPIMKKVAEWAKYTGRLEAVEMVEVRPRVSGFIDSVHYNEGQKVKAGDLLFIIDPRPFEAKVNRLKAQLTQAEAALSLAQANLKRAERLIESNAISQEDADIRKSEALQAEADLAAAEAELKLAELDLGFTRVTAPIDGIADRHEVTVGNVVNGESVNATLLTTIVPHDPIYAYFEVDERSFLRNVRRYFEGELPGRGKGSIPVEMGLADEEGFPFKGETNFASNQLDRDTATLTVRAIFQNPDEFLTPGLFCRLRTQSSKEKDTILIPDSAVGSDQTLRYVWVIGENNLAERRTVELGPKHEGLRIVRTGLTTDETIVINGIQFVRPGAPVTPQPGKFE